MTVVCLRPAEKRASAGGSGTGDFFDRVGELGRMGRLDKEPRTVVRCEIVLQCLEPDCAVRIEQVAVTRLHIPDGFADGTVPIRIAADILTDGLMRVAVQIGDAHEIARVAHIHGIGDGRHRRARFVEAGTDVFGEHVVDIGAGDEMPDRQTGPLGDQPGADIAEVAARHAADHLRLVGHLRIAVIIVERLRQQAGQVDRIGRRQRHGFVQFAVQEGLLHHALAIVECAFDFKRRHIAAQRGELFLLNGAHATLRVQHEHLDARHVVESVGYGAARIARRRHQHIDFAVRIPGEVG